MRTGHKPFGKAICLLLAVAMVLVNLTPAVFAQTAKEAAIPKIAVWDFSLEGIKSSDGRAVTNRLRSELVNSRKYRVMTRDQINTLLGEQTLGQTLVDPKEAIKAGKLKGVQFVVTGTIIALTGAYQITVEMIDGESAEITQSITPSTYRGGFLDFLDNEIPRLAAQLVGKAPAPTVAPAPLPAPASEPQIVLAPEPQPEPAEVDEPSTELRRGFGLWGAILVFGGTVKQRNGLAGQEREYDSSAVGIGVDYQFPVSSFITLNPFLIVAGGRYTGDRTRINDQGSVSYALLGLQVRFNFESLFLAVHVNSASEEVNSDFAVTEDEEVSVVGAGIGGAIGREWPSGWFAMGQLNFMKLESEDESEEVSLGGISGHVGFRF